MATVYYSDLYHTAPNAQAGAAPIYQGPSGHMQKGMTHIVRGTLTIPSATFTTGDTAKLCACPEGARLLRIAIVPSADLDSGNTFTFNLGWNSTANAFAAASTGLQAATAFELKASDTIAAASAAVHGDELLLSRVAGALAAGSLSFVAEFTY
jgi:hypothetical protein